MGFGTASSVSVLVGVLAISGCGGKAKSPVASADTVKEDSGTEPLGEGSTTDVMGDGGGAAEAGTATASTTSEARPEARPESKDECTPVGVEFEKRARPKLKDCYAAGKKKEPGLEGTVKIAVTIDGLGKVKGIKITEKTLPDPVAQCMLKVVKATPLPEASKCPGRTLTIPVTFPTPH